MKTAYIRTTRDDLQDIMHHGCSFSTHQPYYTFLTSCTIDHTTHETLAVISSDHLPKDGWNGEVKLTVTKHTIPSPVSNREFVDYTFELTPV